MAARQLILDYRRCNFNAMDVALCEYAVKLTLRPGDISEADIRRLHEAGWNDDQITIAAQVIGYFNYINRIADGLGVDAEAWMETDPETWRSEKPDWRAISSA